MATVTVVYHSGYGHTQRMAQAVAEGAGASLVAVDAACAKLSAFAAARPENQPDAE